MSKSNSHIFYIIRSASTNKHLPNSKQRNKTSAELSLTEPPRLFSTSAAAKNALRWWREGRFYAIRDQYEEDLTVTIKPERYLEKLEIIAVKLVIVGEQL